ncbi:MAG: c-type cytochrome [bacterium]|nr:c-type cytochrome [bacterium]
MNAKERLEENGLRRWHVAFALIGLAAALLFFISYWQDYGREWRTYQRQYASELRAFLSGQGEKELPPTEFVYIQTVVEEPTRVDRCQMCHRAVDDPRFSKSPQPLTSHPKIPPHPFEKFGCTVCHGGQGRATTVADAHGNVPFWEEPLLKKPFTQASCGSCHRGVDLKDAPLVARGRQLYLQSGCIGCHRIHGVGGMVGPDLTWVGDRRKDPKWHEEHLRLPAKLFPGTTMPPYGHLPKKDLQALVVYMLSLRQAPARLIAAPNVGVAAAKP